MRERLFAVEIAEIGDLRLRELTLLGNFTPLPSCHVEPARQEPIKEPARFPWHEVVKVQHYWLEVDAMTRPMQVRERSPSYTTEEDYSKSAKLVNGER